MKSVEHLISESILQDKMKVKIGGKTMHVARPTIATLIEASTKLRQLPTLPMLQNDEQGIPYVLSYASECGAIGEIVAILFLGKKNLTKEVKLFGHTIYKRDRVKPLADAILENYTSEELLNILSDLLGFQRAGFFLGITTILNGANLLRKTKTETTVSGHSSTE